VEKFNADFYDMQFVESETARVPYQVKKFIIKKYNRLVVHSRRGANTFILDLEGVLNEGIISLSSSDQDICDWCDTRALAAARLIYSGGDIVKYVGGFGLEYPGETENPNGRVIDPLWWRRKVRAIHGRQVEHAARQIGMVNKKNSIYVSSESLERVREMTSRNRRILEGLKAKNEQGDEYSLAELSDLGASNPAVRFSELMARCNGFEQVAVTRGHKCVFYTITCPSRFHSHSKNGREYSGYQGLTPRDGARYLSGVWAKIRASLARKGLLIYGMRVAEPHHDGCPHWHMIVFSPAGDVKGVRDTITRYALEDSTHEVSGNKKIRVDSVDIEIGGSKGGAAAYILKYISKNICGDKAGFVDSVEDAEKSESVRAWASVWGIRQFQQIGGPSVTVWRELRRMRDEGYEGLMGDAVEAAAAGSWAGYVELVGGLGRRCNHLITPVFLVDVDTDTGELPVNKYGELVDGVLVGLECFGEVFLSRFTRWVIERGEGDSFEEMVNNFDFGDRARDCLRGVV